MSEEAEEEGWPFRSHEDDADRRKGRVPDFVRRAFENTMGSVASTQSVSREAIQSILSTTDRTRRELVRLIASEVGDFFRHTDVASEITKILTSVEADVRLSVRFKPAEGGGVEPQVEAKLEDSED